MSQSRPVRGGGPWGRITRGPGGGGGLAKLDHTYLIYTDDPTHPNQKSTGAAEPLASDMPLKAPPSKKASKKT